MSKIKGVKKLNKAIENELSSFKVSAKLDKEFTMSVDDKIITYSITTSEVDKWFDEFVFKTFGFSIENDFVMSLLHEIGHLKTLDNIEDETYEKDLKEKEKITKKIQSDKTDTEKKEKNLHFKYFALPTEIVATAWAVSWARKHPKKYKKMCENTTLAIQEFYKINKVTE